MLLLLGWLVPALLCGWMRGGRLTNLGSIPTPTALAFGNAFVFAVAAGRRLDDPASRYLVLALAVASVVFGAGIWLKEAAHTRAPLTACGLGVAANTLVVALNGGMPVSSAALRVAGGARTSSMSDPLHPVSTSRTHLAWLGDAIPVPVVHAAMSAGDCVVVIGLAWLLIRLMRAPTSRVPLSQSALPAVQTAFQI